MKLMKWVVQDLGDDFPGIDSRPDVCGGEPCIVRTRIPVWLLEQADLKAWAFVRAHQVEIEKQIQDTNLP